MCVLLPLYCVLYTHTYTTARHTVTSSITTGFYGFSVSSLSLFTLINKLVAGSEHYSTTVASGYCSALLILFLLYYYIRHELARWLVSWLVCLVNECEPKKKGFFFQNSVHTHVRTVRLSNKLVKYIDKVFILILA